MAHSLERDPQMESLLEGRKRELGISFEFGMQALAETSSLTVSDSVGAGVSDFDPPIFAASTPRQLRPLNIYCTTKILALSGPGSRQKRPAGGSASMPEPDRIVRMKTVLARTGLSRSTIYRKIAEGTFPPQVRISVNGAGWRESDINRWIADPVAWRP